MTGPDRPAREILLERLQIVNALFKSVADDTRHLEQYRLPLVGGDQGEQSEILGFLASFFVVHFI